MSGQNFFHNKLCFIKHFLMFDYLYSSFLMDFYLLLPKLELKYFL